ncbi:hypothetical protein QBC39DRAFT_396989 [Podospora conica]|nr:hypothetical protein QBC39DRAFT_396989 [Schizothecium conicum]
MLAHSLLLITFGLLAHADDYPCGRQYPETQRSQGFILIANVTDPAKDIFDPPINHWYLDKWRVGAAIATARLSNQSEYLTDSIWFLNGTLEQVRSRSGSINQPPRQYTQLLEFGMQFNPRAWTNITGNSVELHVDFWSGDRGGGISSLPEDPYPTLFPPDAFRSYRFMACNESEPVWWNVRYAIRLGDVIPADCVEITLLAQCATLPLPLLDNDTDGPWNWMVQEVDCYPDVAAIDWTMY